MFMTIFQIDVSRARPMLAALSAAAVLLIPQFAHAQGGPPSIVGSSTLAAAGWGGTTQNTAVCYLFNTGATAVTLAQKGFPPESFPFQTPPPRPLFYDSCGTSVGAGVVCAFGAQIETLGGNACKVTFTQATSAVRGSL